MSALLRHCRRTHAGGMWGFLLAGAMLFSGGEAHADRIYVDGSAAGGGTGASWSSPLRTISAALALDASSYAADEIWVAEGTYPEALTLTLENSYVTLLGGFAAGGAGDLGARDPIAHPTIIDASKSGLGGRACHVIRMGTVVNMRLDGFVLTGGYAEDGPVHELAGGGVLYEETSAATSNTIARCVITANVARTGGAIHVENSAMHIERCWIVGNRAVHGAGVSFSAVWASATGLPHIANSVIAGNIAGDDGGGVYLLDSSPSILQCTIADNRAQQGGGVYGDTASDPTIQNTLFAGNTGYAVYRRGAASCLFFDNPDGDFGNPAYPTIADNVFGDPVFLDGISGTWTDSPALSPDGSFKTVLTDATAAFPENNALRGQLLNPRTDQNMLAWIYANTSRTITVVGDLTSATLTGASYRIVNYRLGTDSAAVDAGAVTPAARTDIDGAARPYDIPLLGANGTGAEFDIGAFEARSLPSARIVNTRATLDFGTAPTGDLVLANRGFGPLSFLATPAISGEGAAAFSVAAEADLSDLDAGATRTISVAFAPTATGIQEARLTLATNDPVYPTLAVALIGAGGYASGWRATQRLSAVSDGTVHLGVFDYDGAAWIAGAQHAGGVSAAFSLPAAGTLGAFLYDYPSGAWTDALFLVKP